MTELHRRSKDFSGEERARLMEQFRSSGLSHHDFAREHNINANTLKNWKWLSEMPPGRRIQRTPVERKKIVEAYLSSQSAGMTMAEFAKVWGVSGHSLNVWLKRFEEFGSEGLMNGKARKLSDKRVGSKLPMAVQDEILRIKKEEPSFGIKKIKQWMYRFSGVRVSTGSISKTVKQNGLKLAKKPNKKHRSSDRVRRFERATPMQMWQSDITQFTMGPSSMRVYLTVFMDDHSRYIVAWRLMSRQTSDLVMDALKDGVVRFGKPQEVLTDQGRQYFAWRGKSSPEDQAQAKQTAQVMMEYWMGHLTKKEAAEKLSLKPVRFWQMSNQAVAGLTAGLLTQPRYRKSAYLASSEVSELKAKVKDLELTVSTQQKLIEILKSLPGVMLRPQGEGRKDGGNKNRAQRADKKQSGLESDDGTIRKSKDGSSSSECNDSNVTLMEEKSEGVVAPA